MADHQKYRITERIDAGGMAEVFRGIAESIQGFKKSVAIKRILPHLTKNKKFISMFLDEARLSLHLQHANIVSIFDIGMAGEKGNSSYFIVMEFVDGAHLKGLVESQRRQGRQLTVAQVLYIMMQVCNGLAYAHDFADPESGRPLGIVHRDISPPNILISKNGEVKLVDFGLAKATSQLESTDPGVVKGKFSYLSPEAASGKEVDRRADIFAVGVLLYEMLTGKRLFYGETDYQTVELVRQARVPSIQQQNREVEAELEAIVRKALARDLPSRYQTAGELQEAIAQYLFSRGMKITSRDIAELVRNCQAERNRAQGPAANKNNLIDTLILEELNKFTSLEGEENSGLSPLEGPGARPLSPEELAGKRHSPHGAHMPIDVGPLVDTSSWTEELTDDLASLNARPQTVASSGRKAPARNGQAGGAGQGQGQGLGDGVPTRMRRTGPEPTQRMKAGGAKVRADTTEELETESLEEILEGEPAGPKADAPVAARQTEPVSTAEDVDERAGSTVRAILAVVVALLIVGGGALVWLMRTRAG